MAADTAVIITKREVFIFVFLVGEVIPQYVVVIELDCVFQLLGW